MNNDLISRKALMVAINTDFYEHFTAHHDSDQTALIDMVMNDIEEIPTAYDVDVVIGELESVKRKLSNCWAPEDKCLTTECTDCALEKAIEIVRNGGNQK